MLTPLATLAAATLFGFWLYGWPAIFLWIVTLLAALLGEPACLKLAGNKALPALRDGSALATGWLLALSLPPWAPRWIVALGGLFATVPAKQVFGFGCGLVTCVIRTWGGYPEGVAFAVLLMNALSPAIDCYLKPRILGRDWRGAPLDPAVEREKT